jgi:hypothetical protein
MNRPQQAREKGREGIGFVPKQGFGDNLSEDEQ